MTERSNDTSGSHLTTQKSKKQSKIMEKCLAKQTMQQRCGSCSCVNVGGDQALASLSVLVILMMMTIKYSPDDNNETITKIQTTSVASVYMEGNGAVALSLCFGHSWITTVK